MLSVVLKCNQGSKGSEMMISTKELCLKLGIHPNTVRNYIKKGMPVLKLEQKFLFNYDEVINWLKNRNK